MKKTLAFCGFGYHRAGSIADATYMKRLPPLLFPRLRENARREQEGLLSGSCPSERSRLFCPLPPERSKRWIQEENKWSRGKNSWSHRKNKWSRRKNGSRFCFSPSAPVFPVVRFPRVAILSSPPAACFPCLLQEALHSVGAVFNSTFCISGIRIPKRLRQSSASRPAGSRISSRVRASTGSSCPRCRP